jgi:demethoxyubiquinone hydroxylase (CLK1/Coq7/Cat5 family)
MHRHSLLLRVLCKRSLSTAARKAEAVRNAACSTSVTHTAAPSEAAAAQTARPSSLFDWKALEAEKKQWRTCRSTLSDLRSDHAGETGAVAIYKGAQWAMSLSPAKYSSDATQFVQEHVVTEQGHLDMIAKLLDPADRSKLLPAWRVAGWCLGALPTLVSEKALFCTVEAVETFVELHYDGKSSFTE